MKPRVHRRLAFLVIIISTLAHSRVAQSAPATEPYLWKSVRIEAGGFITGIVFSPKEPGLAYCRTDIGGAYRMDRKSREWVSLTDWVGPLDSNLGGCESVAPDPVNPDKVYLALGTYLNNTPTVIARSSDAGKTFQLATIPVPMGANQDGRGMGERLAVDPADPRVLYFGSRRNGLWRSADGAETWRRVEAMPVTGGNGGGIPWIIFDSRPSDPSGQPTLSLFAGVASGGTSSLYHSANAGETWQPVTNSPNFMPHRGVLEPKSHTLYVSFGNGLGPNNVTDGAVAKYDIDANQWTDVTPKNLGNGGYGGLTLDPQHPATLMVSTIDHWEPADEIFRSTDGGVTWKPIAAAQRDPALTPYMAHLLRGHRFDWWLAALAIDPFDSNHVLFGTGATIWGTRNMTDFDANQPTRWSIAAEGIEETAVLTLASPPWGAHLISGVGDIGGFTHDDFAVSPTAAHSNPMFANTTSIEFAEFKPVVVRTGTGQEGGAAYSEDGGETWHPVNLPGAAAGGGRRGGGGGAGSFLTVSADGETLLAAVAAGVVTSKDKGITWTPSTGLFPGGRPIADRVAPGTFYALDTATSRLYTSTNGGATFTNQLVSDLPPLADGSPGSRGGRGGGVRLRASFARAGELWFAAEGNLYRSTNAGANFSLCSANRSIREFAFGKAAPGRENPAIFAAGSMDGVPGIYRSDDSGSNWVRVNDNDHQFGGNPTVITADPRIYGRVYLGMNGRGILYGDLVTKE